MDSQESSLRAITKGTAATMRHDFIKRASLIILSALLASSAISCGETASPDDTGDTSAADTSSTDDTSLREVEDDGLPDTDLKGYEFRILSNYLSAVPSTPLYAPEESTGEVVSDAIYDRNRRIEERFNCKITEQSDGTGAWRDHTEYIRTSVLSGDDNFDITMNHTLGGPNISLDGCFMNLNDMKYIDFSKPWWSKQMIDELTLEDQIYLVGDVIGLDALKSAYVLYLNKQAFADRDIALPYQDVLDGKWTLDSLITLTKDIYSDTNGNTTRDAEDFYGYVSIASNDGWLVSCDVPVLEKNDADVLKIVVNGDKVASLVEKLYNFYFETTGSYIVSGNDPVSGVTETQWQANLFAEGHALVALSMINDAATTFRASDDEYGIVPLPKWNGNQDSYRTFCGGNLIGVPITVTEPDKTGLILEALAAETYKTVVPAYFGTALKEMFTYDSESGQMLDIINDSLTVSFAYVYDNWQGFGHMLGALFSGGSPKKDYASFYASREKSAEKRRELIVDYFESNKE